MRHELANVFLGAVRPLVGIAKSMNARSAPFKSIEKMRRKNTPNTLFYLTQGGANLNKEGVLTRW